MMPRNYSGNANLPMQTRQTSLNPASSSPIESGVRNAITFVYTSSTMFNRLICFVAGILAVGSGVVNGHGSHSNDQPPSSDWATRHMMGTIASDTPII